MHSGFSETYYQLSSSVAYRLLPQRKELVVVQLKSGTVLHFSPQSKAFFEFFKSPQTLSSYLKAAKKNKATKKVLQYLENFISFLVEIKILKTCKKPKCSVALASSSSLADPVLLRVATNKLSTTEMPVIGHL